MTSAVINPTGNIGVERQCNIGAIGWRQRFQRGQLEKGVIRARLKGREQA